VAALAIVSIFVKAGWGFTRSRSKSRRARKSASCSAGARRDDHVDRLRDDRFHFLVQIILDVFWLFSKETPPNEWIARGTHGETAVPPPESAS